MRQLGNETNTHEVTPLVVWRPKPRAQEAHVVMEVYVTQLVAVATAQLEELVRKYPLAQTEQVKFDV